MYPRSFAVVIFAALIASCGGGADTPTETGDIGSPGIPSSVVISAPSQSVVAGQTLQLLASARDQAGNTISATITWSSSASAIASVSGAGVVTGVVPGTATITAQATVNGVSASVSTVVTVTAPTVTPVLTSVAINAPAVTVVVGGSLQLTATPRDQNGNPVAATVSWVSSTLGVATVNASGLVSAGSLGSAIITAVATADGRSVSADFALTVTAVPLVLTTVTIAAPATTLRAGTTLQLSAATKDQDGNPIAASVAWGTSDAGKATVNATGSVTGVSAGPVTITAIASASGVIVQSTVQLTVTPPLVLTAVIVTPANPSGIQASETVQLAASPRDQNNDPIVATIAWSTSDATVATVSATGLVTGVAPGTVSITARATAGSVSVSGVVQVMVLSPPVLSSVYVSPTPTSVMVGSTTSLMASPLDQYGGPVAAAVTWGTSDAGTATVNSSGVVSGVAPGTATITATAVSGGVTVMGSATVSVTEVPVLTLVIVSPASPSVTVGSTVQLTASPRDQFNNMIAAAISWGTSDGSKATVSGTGLVSGIAGGGATITATAMAGPVTVSSGVPVTVSATFPLAESVTATAGLQFTPGTVDIARTGTVTWTFLFVHNVTFTGPGAPGGIGNTASGTASVTFNTAGTFAYVCTLHPGMSGTVIVH